METNMDHMDITLNTEDITHITHQDIMEAITVTEVKVGVITATQLMEDTLHITEDPLMAVTTRNMEDTLIGVTIKEEVMRKNGIGTKLMEANLTMLTMVDII